MARLAQALLAVTVLVALPTGAYLTGAMVGPLPRAEDPAPAATTPATSSEDRGAEPGRTPEPASPADTGEVISTSVQQPRQPQTRPRPATEADERPATRGADKGDRDADRRGPAARGWENRGRGNPGRENRGRPDKPPSGPPAAAAVTAGPGKSAKPPKPPKPPKPATPAKPEQPPAK